MMKKLFAIGLSFFVLSLAFSPMIGVAKQLMANEQHDCCIKKATGNKTCGMACCQTLGTCPTCCFLGFVAPEPTKSNINFVAVQTCAVRYTSILLAGVAEQPWQPPEVA